MEVTRSITTEHLLVEGCQKNSTGKKRASSGEGAPKGDKRKKTKRDMGAVSYLASYIT
jgi:hypothetical protein